VIDAEEQSVAIFWGCFPRAPPLGALPCRGDCTAMQIAAPPLARLGLHDRDELSRLMKRISRGLPKESAQYEVEEVLYRMVCGRGILTLHRSSLFGVQRF